MINLKLKSRENSLAYTVTHRPRVTKRLHLELDERGGLVVVAPEHWSRTLIQRIVEQNSRQISRFMARACRQQLPALDYAQGAVHLYLGKHFSLVPCQNYQGLSLDPISGDRLNLPVSSLQPDAVKKALLNWYRQRAKRVFDERLGLMAATAEWARDIEVPLSIRRMKCTWGNCSASGKLKLNVHLIKAPLEIVDSVIAHELCHLKEMNHGSRFYALLEKLDPQWRGHRKVLRADGYRYLQE